MLIVATKLVKMLAYDKEPHPQYHSFDQAILIDYMKN